ncbi:MAG: response regulator [Gammaproteobacteria bacterium]|nr:response regulator [Gammaproteobacteria bacterium]
MLDPRLPDLVRGDAGRLRQILLNLGGNAVKFTQAGEIAIECRVLQQDASGTRVRCEVRDTGIGIPASRMNALFQPFTQVDTSTTRRFGGTGLGLSIVRHLVELMDGECGATSEAGRGSTFWFTARFAPAHGNAGLAVAAPVSAETWSQRTQAIVTSPDLQMPRGRAHRILLAEDNAVNVKVACRLLERLGYGVDVATNGEEAVAAWGRGRYDLILMDCQMPLLDGYGAARRIRATETAPRRIPIVALTAHAMKGADEECVAAGMDDYLAKPIDRNRLAECLQHWLPDEGRTVASDSTACAGASGG